MATLRERFDFERLSAEARPLLARDFVFEPSNVSGLRAYAVEGQTVQLLESPLSVRRHVDLRHRENPHKAIELGMVLCLEGHSDAVERLFWSVESFEREIPDESVTRPEGLGDFGLAWAWEEGRPPHMVAFVRNNLVVTLYAHEPEAMVPVAAELDSMLPDSTVDSYAPIEPWIFRKAREAARGGRIEVDAGARLDLGEPPIGAGESVFFLATGGSVNRDPGTPEARYYRAGLEKGKYEIRSFQVGRGVLPSIEKLDVEIV